MQLLTFQWAGNRQISQDLELAHNPQAKFIQPSICQFIWAKTWTAFPSRATQWSSSIQTHDPVEDASHPIRITGIPGSTSICAFMRSSGTRCCVKLSSSRWFSASTSFFKWEAHSLCYTTGRSCKAGSSRTGSSKRHTYPQTGELDLI